jgi:hypothetical protein
MFSISSLFILAAVVTGSAFNGLIKVRAAQKNPAIQRDYLLTNQYMRKE